MKFYDFFASIRKRVFFQSIYQYFFFYRLPIFSGILNGLSYIPFPPWALLFSFVPLWIFWLKEKSLKHVFIGGWWTQFVFCLMGFSWLPQTIKKFGGFPLPVAFFLFLIFCSLFHLYIPLAGWFCAFIRKKTHTRVSDHIVFIFCLPAFLSLGQLLFPHFFPWNYAAAWMWVKLPIVQLADLIGFQGISVLTLFFNLFFFFAWRNKRSFFAILILTFAFVLFSYLNYLGWSRKESLPVPDSKAQVLIVQGNLGGNLARQYGNQYQEHALDTYIHLTRKALEHYSGAKVDFVVWPEVAFIDVLSSVAKGEERGWRPKQAKKKTEESIFGKKRKKPVSYFSYPEQKRARKLRAFLKENRIALITGAYGKERFFGSVFNGLFLIGREGRNEDTPYYKTHLLAFGEHTPGSKWFPFLKSWLPQVGNLLEGYGPEVKFFNGFKVGPQICYESLFPSFSRELSYQGAEFFVNLTNDSWYDKYQQPYQHLYLAAGRAIEFRRPFIRSTNTGVSEVILADGRRMNSSPIAKEWWHLYSVPYNKNPKPTFYQKNPHLILLLLFFFTACVFLFLFFDLSRWEKKRKEKEKEEPTKEREEKAKKEEREEDEGKTEEQDKEEKKE